jgi:uncharacterized protein (TIGR02171 family)
MSFFNMKNAFVWSSVALIAVLVNACSDSSPTRADLAPVQICTSKGDCPDASLQDGFVLVKSSGRFAYLGTNSADAKANERPQMAVRFDYDFQLSKNEVTCGEFNDLMGGKNARFTLDCENKKLPAADITYYDAVLYANAKSKKAGKDTAYIYSSAEFDKDGHCILLGGFKFDTDVNAFRLPTEAEWMLLARTYGVVSDGWTADNSDYQAHKVCSKNPDADVCDMAGNVMEWVNDWLGNFRDTLVTNFVGAPDGGSLGQRIVKGGSFRNSAESISMYSRGDVYTVTSSTRANYVGFRLAFGAIPDAVWMDNDGKASDSRIVSLLSSKAMRSLVGTSKVKLAFRNEVSGNLAFIDYASRASSVVEIDDSIDVYHPDISPDGKHVAFCTGMEGVSGKSSLYVRDLNAGGTNLVKLDVENAVIPRWRVLENGDTIIVYVTSAANNSNESDFISASTWQVKFANGKFEKPKKLFDGAYHGGISGDNSLAVSGARLLRARVAKPGSTVLDKATDTVWYNEEQACNASLAKDSSKRTLFLDFGGKTGRKFVGTNYGTHERLLIANAKGKLIQSVASPKGYAFDHSEWTIGGVNNVIATLTNINGAHVKIALVNLSDSTIVELAEGEELWHPSLWVKDVVSYGDEQIDPDSAGVYFVEGQDWSHESLGYKMTMLWNYKDDVEVLCVGSSRMENGVVATEIKSGFALNVGHMGNDMNASMYIAENYGANHLSKLKTVVIGIDIDLWHNKMEFTNEMILNTPGFVYDQNHSFWKDELPEMFMEAVESGSYSDHVREVFGKSRGFYSEAGPGWGTPLVVLDSNWKDWRQDNLYWNVERLEKFINHMDSLYIKVIGVVFPQNPRYTETGAWGRYGPQRSVAEGIMESVRNMDRKYSNFILLDEYKDGYHDYPDSYSLNTDHLSVLGAQHITARIDSVLKTLK